MKDQLNSWGNKGDAFCMAGSYTTDEIEPKIPIEEKKPPKSTEMDSALIGVPLS